MYRYGQYYSRVHRQHQLLAELHTISTSTGRPVPAVPVPEQYLAVPAPEYSQLCTSTAQRHNVIGTTYQHNTDTTMGITITDNLVDTTLYRDH